MNREETKAAIKVLQASVDGAIIQQKCRGHSWEDMGKRHVFLFDSHWEYRIKKEPREFWIWPTGIGIYGGRDFEIEQPAGPEIKVREII